MFDVKKQLAVQSWCFRHFKTIDALIAQIKGIGLMRTELCGVQIDFNNEATYAPAIAQLQQAGIKIDSIGVQYFKGDAAEEKWFRFCKAAGAKMISASFRIDSVPDSYRVVEKWAEKHDLLIGVHNHGGYNWLGSGDMLRHVLKNTSERFGLCLDSAWCIQAGEDPLKWAEEFNSRVYGVHIKDFIFHRTGKWEDVVVGTGNLKLKEFLALALKAPKLAAVTLEFEGSIENPGPQLQQCVDQIAAAV